MCHNNESKMEGTPTSATVSGNGFIQHVAIAGKFTAIIPSTVTQFVFELEAIR